MDTFTQPVMRSRRTEGVTYICRGPGALLCLPCGGYREDAIHKERIRDNVVSSYSNARTKETLTADAVLKFLHENKISVLIENGGK
jgi:hypothetical protein